MKKMKFIIILMCAALLTPCMAAAQSTPWEWMMDYAQFDLKIKSAEVIDKLPADLRPPSSRGKLSLKYKKKKFNIVLVTIEGITLDKFTTFLFAEPVFHAVFFPSKDRKSPRFESALAFAVKYPPEFKLPRQWYVPATKTTSTTAQIPIKGPLTFQALFLLPKEVNRFYIKCTTFVKGEAVLESGVGSQSK